MGWRGFDEGFGREPDLRNSLVSDAQDLAFLGKSREIVSRNCQEILTLTQRHSDVTLSVAMWLRSRRYRRGRQEDNLGGDNSVARSNSFAVVVDKERGRVTMWWLPRMT